MEKRKIITIALILMASVLQAQVPGYMGKRAYLLVDLNPAPAILNMNMNHKLAIKMGDFARVDNINLLAFNIRPQLSFEYLVGKNMALGLNYQRIITGTIKEVDESSSEISLDILRGNAAGIDLKLYKFKKSNSIAPIGYYGKLGLSLISVNTFDNKNDNRKQFKYDLNYPAISWGFGKQFMPFENLLVGTGAEFSLPFMSSKERKSGVYDSDESVNHMHRSLMGYYLFNLKLSVGYMLF